MITKEALHHLVEELPEDQNELARALLEDLRDAAGSDPSLDAEALAALDRGLAKHRRGTGQTSRCIQTRTRIVNYRVSVSHEAEKVPRQTVAPVTLRRWLDTKLASPAQQNPKPWTGQG